VPRRPLRRYWTEAEDAVLLALHRQGKSVSFIAARLRRSQQAVRARTAQGLKHGVANGTPRQTSEAGPALPQTDMATN
jgi:hypothetical protein